MRHFRFCVKFLSNLYVLLSVFAFSFCAFAKEIQVPSIDPLFELAEKKDDFSGREIISLALKFGLAEESSARWTETLGKYETLLSELQQFRSLGEAELAEKILVVMYEMALDNYEEFTTKIDEALLDGVYNCVSSSLLYLALAKDFGIDARVQETARHAFVTIYTAGGEKIDVETTNPLGFAPGTRRMISQNSSGTKKFATVPKHYYSNKIEISEKKAVTLPGKNIASINNNRHNYGLAVPLSAAIYNFVTASGEKEMCRGDMDIVFGNFASYADRNGEQETAIEFIENVWNKYGRNDRLSLHYNNAVYNWALSLCEANKYESAWQVYNEHSENLDGQNLADIKTMIYANEVVYKSKSMGYDEGIKYMQKERATAKSIGDKKISQTFESLEQMHWANKINVFFEKGDFLTAAAICDEALLSLPKNSYLTDVKTRSLYNHSAEVHNKALPLINEKKYSEAMELLEAGLKANPTSKMIEKDMATVRKMMGQ